MSKLLDKVTTAAETAASLKEQMVGATLAGFNAPKKLTSFPAKLDFFQVVTITAADFAMSFDGFSSAAIQKDYKAYLEKSRYAKYLPQSFDNKTMALAIQDKKARLAKNVGRDLDQMSDHGEFSSWHTSPKEVMAASAKIRKQIDDVADWLFSEEYTN
jgi:hypothetical protein